MSRLAQGGAALVVSATLAGACARSDRPGAAGTASGTADSATRAAAAAKPTEFRVSNVMIGRHVGSGNRITDPTFQFAPQDTVYLSVMTEGSAKGGTLTTAWRSQTGEILQQGSEPVAPAGENTAFHLSQPKGLKPGTYKVVVFLGNDSVDTKAFVVKK